MALENEFITELGELIEISKKAGYLNHLANQTQKMEDVRKYEQARNQQQRLYDEFLEKYSPSSDKPTKKCETKNSSLSSLFSHCLGGSCSICPYKSLK